MGKFSLLTTLTLNAAGYNQGIDQAKKQTKALSDGIKTAGSAAQQAFGGIAGIAGEAGSKLSGVASMAKGGITAFKSMIPAINGVRTAIVSTGIGAIVVAIGMAFAALSSYLNGTSEGANKLNKILAIAKGVFSAILARVQLLGEAVALVFQGKFGEAGKKLKEAFAGGILDEVKAKVEKNLGLAERENQLWKERLDWGYKEAELNKELNRLKLVAEDKDKGVLERQKAINGAIAVQKQISEQNNKLATEEYEIQKLKNAGKDASREDREKELELYKKQQQVIADEYSKLKEMTAKKGELNNQAKTELQQKKDANQLDKIAIGNLSVLGAANIKPINLDKTAIQEYKGEMLGLNQIIFDFALTIQNNLVNAIGAMTDAFMQGGNSFKEYAKNIKSAIKQTIGAFIAEGVAAMVGNALKSSAKLGPIGLALAPALAALAGGLAKTAFNSLVPKFAFGGIVGGQSFTGDKVQALVNSGEMILNRSQQANLFRQINSGFGGGELTTRVSGSDLIFVLNNAQRRNNSYR